MKLLKTFTAFLCCLLMFSACSNSYEQYQSFADKKWGVGEELSFEVPVRKEGVYNLYLSFRHTDAYAYNNLWVQLLTEPHNDKAFRERYNFTLADIDGRWLGSSVGELHDHQYLIRERIKIAEPGNYRFKLKHDMRSDTLTGMVDAGLKLVKVE